MIKFDTNKEYILIQGDLSGIQSYILKFQQQATSGLAKILRARSFYLSLISKTVEDKICKELNFSKDSIIMSAGSKFLLVGEYFEAQNDILENIQRELDDWLLKKYMGDITFLLAWNKKPFTDEQIVNSFKEVNKQVREILEKKKNNKLKSVLTSNEKWNPSQFVFINAYNDLVANGECAVQGFYPGEIYDSKENRYLNKVSFTELETGMKLPHNKFIYFEHNSNADTLSLPFKTTFFLNENSNGNQGLNIERFAPANLPKFTNWEESVQKYEQTYCNSCNEYGKEILCEILVGFKKDKNYQPKSFHCLAQESKTLSNKQQERNEWENSNDNLSMKGEAFLGIFKADLDNAGIYFQESSSIEDYNKRSEKVNDFFGKKLNDLIQNEPRYKSSVYTVFAGGDDLFLIGTYTKLLEFIQKLQEEFTKAFDGKLTFSAGFALSKPRTPIQLGATKAEQGLKLSKDYGKEKENKDKKEKNAITIFGTTMSWEEYKEALDDIAKILDFIEKGLAISFLYRLLHFYKENKRVANDPKAVIWKSHFAYAKRRNIWQNNQLFKGDKQDKIKVELDTLITNILSERKIHYANVVLQLAIYQSRGGK